MALAIYILFSKDWKSLSQMFMVSRLHNLRGFNSLLFFRSVFITLNEIVMFAITCCTNIAEDGIIGLIVNFSAALIICELDDIVMSTGRIQRY